MTEEKKHDNSSTVKKNPYRSLHFYKEEDEEFFKGRDDEKLTLFHQVKYNQLTIVFGQSGIGKTSLLNAGLFPLLRKENFLPVYIRLRFEEFNTSLLRQIYDGLSNELTLQGIKLTSALNETPISIPFSEEVKNQTLWEYFQIVKHYNLSKGKQVIPVIIFDQFEEWFTLGKNHNFKDKNRLIDELYWLIENQFPDPVAERIPEMDKETRKFFYSLDQPNVRIIISLREDFLPHFITLKSRIPSLDRSRFRVIHLNGKQARQIINIGHFNKKLTESILEVIPQNTSFTVQHEGLWEESLEIEPFLLSLICSRLFDREQVEPLTNKDTDGILEEFYDKVMDKFSDKVKEYIELNFLTDEGFRTPIYIDHSNAYFNDIEELINRRILRKTYVNGKQYVEIIHDVLSKCILEKRNKRLIEEKEREYKKKTKIYRFFTYILLSFLVILIILTVYAFKKENEAHTQLLKVQELSITSRAQIELRHDNTKAIQIAEKAYSKGRPYPQSPTSQTLSMIGYSSLETPFYVNQIYHKDAIYCTVFSPKGKMLATASEDCSVKIWDLRGNRTLTLDKHTARVTCCAFSPDGNMIITGSGDKTAKIWTKRGQYLFQLKHDGAINAVSFSHKGNMILTGSTDGKAKLWSSRGELICEIKHNRSIIAAIFSPSDTHILTASDNIAQLWNTKGILLKEFHHKNEISSIAFSPNEQLILSSSWDNSAKLWNPDGSMINEFIHNNPVTLAKFFPNGQNILTISLDKMVRIFDINGKLLAELLQQGEINDAVISNDGKKILITSKDKSIKLFSKNGKLLIDLKKFNDSVYTGAFSPNGRYIATACEDGSGKIWDIESNLVLDFCNQFGEVNNTIFSPDGQYILSLTSDAIARLWNTEGELKTEFKGHQRPITSALFTLDGKSIITASLDKSIRVWDLKGHCEMVFAKHLYEIVSIDLSPDGKFVLSTSADGAVKIWNWHTGLELHSFDNSNEQILSTDKAYETMLPASFSKDGLKILSAISSRKVALRKLNGKVITIFKHKDIIYSATFSSNGDRIITASADHTAKVWDLDGRLLKDITKHKEKVINAIFSGDDKYIISASIDGTAILWKQNGDYIAELKHNGIINSIVFSADNKYILTSSTDGTAKMWDLQGNLLADMDQHKGPVLYANFSPNPKTPRICTASKDGTAKLWYTPEGIYYWLKTTYNKPFIKNNEF